jgi:hypothetical protein
MSLVRSVEPEWLDELPADDVRAARSRRDLRRINGWMRQTAIMAQLFKKYAVPPPKNILELGSGDGTFMLGVARRLASCWPHVRLVLLDRQNIVTEATRDKFRALGWQAELITADVFDFLDAQEPGAADLISANLFLHHFSDDQLRRLFVSAARLTRLFIACEPERSAFALTASHMLFAIGCNDVTRHDAVVSVRAGFGGRDLSKLWPAEKRWTLREQIALPFTHGFVARGTDA